MCSVLDYSSYLCNSFSLILMIFSKGLPDRKLIKPKSINLAKHNGHYFSKLSEKFSDSKFALNKSKE